MKSLWWRFIGERRRSLEREQLEFSLRRRPGGSAAAGAMRSHVSVAEQDEVWPSSSEAFEQARDAAEAVASQVREEQEPVAVAEQAADRVPAGSCGRAEQSVTGGQRLVAATQSRADRLAEQYEPAAARGPEGSGRRRRVCPRPRAGGVERPWTPLDAASRLTRTGRVELARAELSPAGAAPGFADLAVRGPARGGRHHRRRSVRGGQLAVRHPGQSHPRASGYREGGRRFCSVPTRGPVLRAATAARYSPASMARTTRALRAADWRQHPTAEVVSGTSRRQ